MPAGLYYTSKTKFRSEALLYFGRPIDVHPVALEEGDIPPRGEVRELSSRIETALREVMLDAQHEEALHTITRAEKIFSAAADEPDESLAQELQLQQRFIKAYSVLLEHAPERLQRLETRLSDLRKNWRRRVLIRTISRHRGLPGQCLRISSAAWSCFSC